jgi:hypothetical protein
MEGIMGEKNFVRRTLFAAAAAMALTGAERAHAACVAPTDLDVPNASVTSVEEIPAGSYRAPNGVTYDNLPGFCRVLGAARPTSESNIGFEVWIPSNNWKKRFLQVGTLIYAGAIEYGSLAFALRRGYATATSNAGHVADTFDASWVIGHPQLLVDWAHRAVAQTAVVARAVIKAETHQPPLYSYFFGASNGGREAWILAQRYPHLFDGVIADAPTAYWTHQGFAWMNTQQAEFEDPRATIVTAKLPAIQAAAVAQCDAVDGVVDGVVDDPRRCSFNAAAMLCTGPETNSCLTAPQVKAMERMMRGPINTITGARILPGYEPFAVATSRSWDFWTTGAGHGVLASQFFANMAFQTGIANFDYTKINYGADVARADFAPVLNDTLGHTINAIDPDLHGFRNKRGKMITYIGWEDEGVPPRFVVDYYEAVIAAMGAHSGAPHAALEETRKFFRLFMVPGMVHQTGGAGGPGANAFGTLFGLPGLAIDRRYDVLSALEAWVERGIEPERIIGAKYVNDAPTQGVAFTRMLCPYPQVARWKGFGDNRRAETFECVHGPRGAYLQ